MVEIIGYLSLISSYSMSVTKISHTFPRARSIISSGEPSNFSSPRFSKASFLQVLEMSPTIWVERIMMESLSLMSDRMLRNRILSSGSSPVVGSSTIITFGFPMMAWAIPSLRFIPPDNRLAQRSRTSNKPTLRSISSTTSARCCFPLIPASPAP